MEERVGLILGVSASEIKSNQPSQACLRKIISASPQQQKLIKRKYFRARRATALVPGDAIGLLTSVLATKAGTQAALDMSHHFCVQSTEQTVTGKDEMLYTLLPHYIDLKRPKKLVKVYTSLDSYILLPIGKNFVKDLTSVLIQSPDTTLAGITNVHDIYRYTGVLSGFVNLLALYQRMEVKGNLNLLLLAIIQGLAENAPKSLNRFGIRAYKNTFSCSFFEGALRSLTFGAIQNSTEEITEHYGTLSIGQITRTGGGLVELIDPIY